MSSVISNFDFATILLRFGYTTEESLLLSFGQELSKIKNLSDETKDVVFRISSKINELKEITDAIERKLRKIILDLLLMELLSCLKKDLLLLKAEIVEEIIVK